MDNRTPAAAFLELVRARVRATGLLPERESKLREVGLAKMGDLLKKATTRDQSSRVGLVWALRLAERAAASDNPNHLDQALFRFAHHLRRSEGPPTSDTGRVMAYASDLAFRSLRRPPSDSFARAEGSIAIVADDGAWLHSIGVDQRTFDETMAAIRAFVRVPRSQVGPASAREGTTEPAATTPIPEVARFGPKHVPAPPWLQLPAASESAPLLTPVRSWELVAEPGTEGEVLDLRSKLQEAWNAFVEGDLGRAASLSNALRISVGTAWHCDSGTEALQLWTWLRLVGLLADRADEPPSIARLRASSSLILASRLGMSAESWPGVERLVESCVLGLTWREPLARREAAGLTARLSAVLDHEDLRALLPTHDVPEMRSAWREQFKSLGMHGKSSLRDQHEVLRAELNSLFGELSGVMQQRDGRLRAESLFALVRRAEQFTSEEERQRLAALREVMADYTKMSQEYSQGGLLAPVIDGLIADVVRVVPATRALPSSLVHEASLPALAWVWSEATRWRTEVSDRPQPQLRADLRTRRFPLSGAPGESFAVEVALSNVGRAPALSVDSSIGSAAFEVATSPDQLIELRPGATRTLSWNVHLVRSTSQSDLEVGVTWMDEFEQRFESNERFAIEAERLSAWTEEDANPFTGHAVRSLDDLVGRDRELRILREWSLSGTSCYLTGQKRVGKTSMARVHLQQAASHDIATRYLPLGRTGAKSGNPADLMIAITERVSEAVAERWPELGLGAWSGTGTAAEAARSAGRWFEKASELADGQIRVLLVLDDFDELPPRMYEGEESEELFTFLRPAFDEPWLSIVFVGSEVLPTIMKSQSIKWNLVQALEVSDFGSAEDSAKLLRGRSAHRLEWDDAAIESLHTVCSGNPFFLVRVATHVWRFLREQDRAHVQLHDVEEAVHAYLSQVEPSDFQHFWVDSRHGVDPSSDVADRSALVLRGVGRCIAAADGRAARETVLASAAELGGHATGQDLAATLNDLEERRVLVSNPETDSVGVRVPLFGRWLRGAGDQALDAAYHHQRRGRISKWSVRPGEIVELCDGLRYQNEPINEIRVQGWLEGFGEERYRYLAFRILQRFVYEGYFPSDRLGDLWSRLAKEVRNSFLPVRVRYGARNDADNLFIVDFGEPGSSARGVPSTLRTSFQVRKDNVVAPNDVIDRVRPHDEAVLLVLDDFIGSGSTIMDVLGQLGRSLDAWQTLWRDRVRIIVGACVADARGVADVERLPECAAVVTAFDVPPRLRAFDEDSGLFESHDDREDMRSRVEEIGRELYPRHPLGWEEQGLLVGFERNVPNNTLPIFWSSGRFHGRRWVPLFPRSS